MPIPNIPQNPKNTNNPSKEILAATGIYSSDFVSSDGYPYAVDLPDITTPNTGRQTTTISPVTILDHALRSSNLSSGNYFIDNMQIFNDYRHYSGGLRFNPQSFLQQSIVTFNIYNLDKR